VKILGWCYRCRKVKWLNAATLTCDECEGEGE
jgi:hypothetical protein